VTTASSRHDPIDLANYLARRTVMLAVVAFVGLTLSLIIVSGLSYIWVSSADPFNQPDWLEPVIGFFGVGGFLWFVVFLIMSINAMRLHSFYHRQIVP
jgi:hypothetical protein